MKFKQTIILFIILVLAVSAVYYLEFTTKKNEGETVPAARIFKIKKQDIKKIKIFFSGDSSEFVKENGKWSMVFPVQARGSDYSLDLIARDIEELLYDRIISNSDSSLETFGLNRPTIQTQFSTVQNEVHTIQVGNLNMKETFYFMMVDNKPPVYTISSIIKTSWARTGKELRSKKIFSMQKDDVSDFSLRRGTELYQIHKVDGKWDLVVPIHTHLIQASVDSWLDKIFSTEVKEFVAETLAPANQFSLTHPRIELSLNEIPENGVRAERIGLGTQKGNGVYVSNTRENKIYSIDSSFTTQFRLKITDWIDKKVISVSRDSVDRFVIYKPSDILSIKKFPKDIWLIEPTLVDTVLKESIDTYLDQITKLNFSDVAMKVDKKEIDAINNSQTKIVLWKKDQIIAEIIIGSKQKDQYCVKGNLIGKVARSRIDDLLLSKSRLLLKEKK